MKKSTCLLIISLLMVSLFTGCGFLEEPLVKPSVSMGDLTGELLSIHYLDVGQGDSIFITLPNGETMLIDAGEQNSSDYITEYIFDNGNDTLDYVVATHPHADHIGGMASVLDAFRVGRIYMPNATASTKGFERLLDSIESNGLKIKTARAGMVIFDYGNIKAEFIAPNSEKYDNLNNYSAVVRLTYNDKQFLFMGDAEKESEDEILEAKHDISADVLKVGHHGSRTSSTKPFISAVAPSAAVISSGEGNSYGHPADATLETFNALDVDVYRTDQEGTVVIVCNGEEIRRAK